MMGYGMEFFVEERIRERLREAEGERLARAVAAEAKRGRPRRARLILAVFRRLARVGEAS